MTKMRSIPIKHITSLFDINKDIKLICLSGFVFFFGDGLFTFVLPVYIRQLNASPTNVGMLYAVYYLSLGATIIFGGLLADHFDAKKILIMNAFLWVPVPIALVFATNWQQLWLPMLLYGTFFASPALFIYILKSAARGKVMQAFSIWSISTALGYIFSPLIGGTIAYTMGKQTVFALASIFYIGSISPLFFISKQPKRENKVEKTAPQFFRGKVIKSTRLIFICCFFAVTSFSICLLQPFIFQFTHGVYHQTIFSLGVFGTLTSVGWIFFSIGFGKLGYKKSKMDAVIASIIVSIFSFSFIVLIDNFVFLCFASFLSGASNIIIYFMGGVIGCAAPEQSAGRWIAICQACMTFAGVSAPIIGGVLYELSPYLAFWATILILSGLAIIGLSKKL